MLAGKVREQLVQSLSVGPNEFPGTGQVLCAAIEVANRQCIGMCRKMHQRRRHVEDNMGVNRKCARRGHRQVCQTHLENSPDVVRNSRSEIKDKLFLRAFHRAIKHSCASSQRVRSLCRMAVLACRWRGRVTDASHRLRFVHRQYVLAGNHQRVACGKGIAGRQVVDEGGNCDLSRAGGRRHQARFWRLQQGAS